MVLGWERDAMEAKIESELEELDDKMESESEVSSRLGGSS